MEVSQSRFVFRVKGQIAKCVASEPDSPESEMKLQVAKAKRSAVHKLFQRIPFRSLFCATANRINMIWRFWCERDSMWAPDCLECEISLNRGVAGEPRCECDKFETPLTHRSQFWSVSQMIMGWRVVSTKARAFAGRCDDKPCISIQSSERSAPLDTSSHHYPVASKLRVFVVAGLSTRTDRGSALNRKP